jgi:hypothetical protein
VISTNQPLSRSWNTDRLRNLDFALERGVAPVTGTGAIIGTLAVSVPSGWAGVLATGSLAVIAAAGWIVSFRTWRDNRRFHAERHAQEERRREEEQERTEESQRLEQERQKRQERFERQRRDYDASMRNLDQVQRACTLVIDGPPLTVEAMNDLQLAVACRELRQIGDRITGLRRDFEAVAVKALALSKLGLAEDATDQRATEVGRQAVEQYRAALEARTCLEVAWQAVDREWGS